MFERIRSGRSFFRSVLVRYGYAETGGGDPQELYVGEGDRFDDDRRVVRKMTSALRRGPFGALCAVPLMAFRRRLPHRRVQD